ncbi:phosphatase [Pseudomonas indica]|uniref:Beta-phosphoglucomutase, HAD superfamily n=1 Tax=Pseudomonas indica TaxID=137658 RepID=A0A1G9END1_9PSED|nr:phosphatase [Pseudomonas indica]SDK77515.1 Beta-phosphoglucomutase, HAD superfamily [Pseudomonas indica]
MPATTIEPPAFSAVLFGLSGCLVDFGARTLPVALQYAFPRHQVLDSAERHPETALRAWLERVPDEADRHTLTRALTQAAVEHAELTPGCRELLADLFRRDVRCTWLDELPSDTNQALASVLPDGLVGVAASPSRPWPAPDACWQALMAVEADDPRHCVLVSGDPRLLRSGLNAGVWTVGLAACGPLCGLAPADWQALAPLERDRLRAQATLELYRLGAHSVIDHLGDLATCLEDLAVRRQKGEKP